MIYATAMSFNVWAEACNIAVYLHNQSASASNKQHHMNVCLAQTRCLKSQNFGLDVPFKLQLLEA